MEETTDKQRFTALYDSVLKSMRQHRPDLRWTLEDRETDMAATYATLVASQYDGQLEPLPRILLIRAHDSRGPRLKAVISYCPTYRAYVSLSDMSLPGISFSLNRHPDQIARRILKEVFPAAEDLANRLKGEILGVTRCKAKLASIRHEVRKLAGSLIRHEPDPRSEYAWKATLGTYGSSVCVADLAVTVYEAGENVSCSFRSDNLALAPFLNLVMQAALINNHLGSNVCARLDDQVNVVRAKVYPKEEKANEEAASDPEGTTDC